MGFPRFAQKIIVLVCAGLFVGCSGTENSPAGKAPQISKPPVAQKKTGPRRNVNEASAAPIPEAATDRDFSSRLRKRYSDSFSSQAKIHAAGPGLRKNIRLQNSRGILFDQIRKL